MQRETYYYRAQNDARASLAERPQLAGPIPVPRGSTEYMPINPVDLYVRHLISQAEAAGAVFMAESAPLAGPDDASAEYDETEDGAASRLATMVVGLAVEYDLDEESFLMPDDDYIHLLAWEKILAQRELASQIAS